MTTIQMRVKDISNNYKSYVIQVSFIKPSTYYKKMNQDNFNTISGVQ